MTKIKITGCYYTKNGKTKYGLQILNRKTNTFTIINKKLEKETGYTNLVTCADSIGNVIMDI